MKNTGMLLHLIRSNEGVSGLMEMTIERAMQNARASVEMEGFTISDETMALCRLLLEREISYDEFLNMAFAKAGVAVQ